MPQEISHKWFAFYLQKLGWKEVRSNQKSINVYLEPNQKEPFEIYLPTKLIQGYEQKILDAISTLCIVLDKPQQVVINMIKGLNNDLHNYRITNSNTGGVKLSLMQTLLNANRVMLLNASRYTRGQIYQELSAKDKKSHKSPTEASKSYLTHCNFMHTWPGSFGITIKAPLNLPSLGLLDSIPDTVERKTTKVILKGFSLINGAVEKKSHDYIIDNIDSPNEFLVFNSFPEVLNTIKSYSIEYSVNTSPIIPIGKAFEQFKKAEITEKSLLYVDKAIEQLKEPDTEKNITIVGFPTTIKASKEDILSPKLFEESRKVIVKGVSRDIEFASLTMHLSLEDYKKAIAAQSDAKDVKVRCKVKKKNKGWEVLSVKSFELI